MTSSIPSSSNWPRDSTLRPIRASDVDIDYPAVMGSRTRLWSKYGDARGWPPPDRTYEADRVAHARHEAEIAAHVTFNHAALDKHETELLGCAHVDPPNHGSPEGADAVASWWVVDQHAGSRLERQLDQFVPRRLTETWPFRAVHHTP